MIIVKGMKNYIVTGASGLIASELICQLQNSCQCTIYAVSSDPHKLLGRYANNNVICLSLDELKKRIEQERLHFHALIHCAFARSKSGRDIASSLDYLESVLGVVKSGCISAFINISSQSVYGQSEPPLWSESTPADPDYLYAMGKYASEAMTNAALSDTNVRYTNIRLSSVSENARFLAVFVRNALKNIPIKVMGGTQSCSFIDVRDVAEALTLVATLADSMALRKVYNLSTGVTRTIAELAEDVRRIYKTKYNGNAVIINEEFDVKLEVGMDNTLFCNTFNWAPRYGYDDMIEALFDHYIKKQQLPN
ncbi:MAG: NAD(P)-dependent oxidoreductase [Clostridia bacterium]|nr:NAD(P)-dependent oxidoreductase [Clostridia bacterium]